MAGNFAKLPELLCRQNKRITVKLLVAAKPFDLNQGDPG